MSQMCPAVDRDFFGSPGLDKSTSGATMSQIWIIRCSKYVHQERHNIKTQTTNLNFIIVRCGDKVMSFSRKAEFVDRCRMTIHTANLHHINNNYFYHTQSQTKFALIWYTVDCRQTAVQRDIRNNFSEQWRWIYNST